MRRKIIRKGINKRSNQRKRGSSGGRMFHEEVDSYTVTLWNRTNTAGFNAEKKCPSWL